MAAKTDESAEQELHESDSLAQRNAEAIVLAGVSEQMGTPINQKVRLAVDEAFVELDGVSEDESIFVEVFARIGRLRGAQLHKISTDVLKLITVASTRPQARLVLAFADQEAADSVVGWRAAVLKRHGISKLVVKLDEGQRREILEAQAAQKRGMTTDGSAEPT